VFDVVEAVLMQQLAGNSNAQPDNSNAQPEEQAATREDANLEADAIDAAAEAEQRYQRQRERVMEICAGVVANLASHAHLAVTLAQEHPSLVELLTEGLLLCSSSTPILCELCRLGSVALRMPVSIEWVQRMNTCSNPADLPAIPPP
jgi:hypothetical protein